VADGANQARGRTYPEQVRKVMKEYENFYRPYGIQYFSPVYELPGRTDHTLHQMGIYPQPNVKTDVEANAKIEQNCNYKSIYHTVSVGYYKNLYGDDEFENITIRYYKEKFAWIHGLVDEYISNNGKGILASLIDNGVQKVRPGQEGDVSN